MNPVWHALWLAVETAAWFLTVAVFVLGAYLLAAGLTHRRASHGGER